MICCQREMASFFCRLDCERYSIMMLSLCSLFPAFILCLSGGRRQFFHRHPSRPADWKASGEPTDIWIDCWWSTHSLQTSWGQGLRNIQFCRQQTYSQSSEWSCRSALRLQHDRHARREKYCWHKHLPFSGHCAWGLWRLWWGFGGLTLILPEMGMEIRSCVSRVHRLPESTTELCSLALSSYMCVPGVFRKAGPLSYVSQPHWIIFHSLWWSWYPSILCIGWTFAYGLVQQIWAI